MNKTYHVKKRHTKLKWFVAIIVVLILFNPLAIRFYMGVIKHIANSDGLSSFSNDYSGVEADGDLVSEQEIKALEDSKITGEEYQFDSTYYPYFYFLNDSEKQLYKQIYANANDISKYFVPTVDINISQVKKVFEAVYNDHPELFWLNTSYSYKYTPDNKCVQIILSFNETINDIENAKKKFNSAANTIIAGANKLSSNYEKEKYVHDAIVTTVKYDKNASMNQSAYSALVNKSTICAGYARAFQYIMINLHIPTYYCVGISSVNHAWNIVKLSDGYYNVDLTWDNSDSSRYKYFNRTDNDFSITHKRTGLSLNLPKCNATKYRTSNTKASSSSSVKKSNTNSNVVKSNVNSSLNNNKVSNVITSNEVSNKQESNFVDNTSNETSNNEIDDSNNLNSDENLDSNNEIDDSENNNDSENKTIDENSMDNDKVMTDERKYDRFYRK